MGVHDLSVQLLSKHKQMTQQHALWDVYRPHYERLQFKSRSKLTAYDNSKRRALASPSILSARSNRKKAVFILKQKHAGSELSPGWMSHADPHSETHHSDGVIYVDAATK